MNSGSSLLFLFFLFLLSNGNEWFVMRESEGGNG